MQPNSLQLNYRFKNISQKHVPLKKIGQSVKAIIYENYGPPSVLHVAEVDKPTPKTGEILVHIRAVEVTKADCELRAFRFPVKWFSWPLRAAMGIRKPKNKILGGYFAGEVVALGKDVQKFSIGDNVLGAAGFSFGAYGEYMCVAETATLAQKAPEQSFKDAAAMPLGGLNGLHFMRKAKISPGDRVLITGAGGSIGLFALQIAKSMGAEVTAVDHPSKEKMLRDIGADHFIDYTTQNFTKSANRYDVVLNMIVSNSYSEMVKLLTTNGKYLMGNPRISDMLRTLLTNKLTKKTASFTFAGEKVEELQTLCTMVSKAEIRSVVDRVFSMEQAAEAHEMVETEKRIGSIVIAMP